MVSCLTSDGESRQFERRLTEFYPSIGLTLPFRSSPLPTSIQAHRGASSPRDKPRPLVLVVPKSPTSSSLFTSYILVANSMKLRWLESDNLSSPFFFPSEKKASGRRRSRVPPESTGSSGHPLRLSLLGAASALRLSLRQAFLPVAYPERCIFMTKPKTSSFPR